MNVVLVVAECSPHLFDKADVDRPGQHLLGDQRTETVESAFRYGQEV